MKNIQRIFPIAAAAFVLALRAAAATLTAKLNANIAYSNEELISMKPIFNRAPLVPNQMAALPLGAVRPAGWLREQLETAAKGLTGKLHTFWPDVKESAWRGGEGDGWERAPYYLDGLVPLAYLLEDEELIAVCKEYIEDLNRELVQVKANMKKELN